MRPFVHFIAAASLLAACSPAGAPAFPKGRWEKADRYRDVCAALWRGETADVAVSVSNVPNVAGISVVSEGTKFARHGRFEPDVRMAVNGTDIEVTTLGIVSEGHRGLLLRFDPLPLLVRHPDGFRLVLSRGAAPIGAFDLQGASVPFAEIRRCAQTLPGAADR